MTVEKQYISFGSMKIEFDLIYNGRKTLGITVTPDMEVVVKAPANASLEKVKEKVRKKAPWIIKQKGYFLSFHPKTPPKKFISGESHYYLGKQFRLKVISGKKSSVHYKAKQLDVITPSKIKTKELVKQWYRQRAKEKFAEIAEPLIQRFKKYKINLKGIYIQEMTTRWGSCSPKGRIILNPELIQAPKGCIEYVIIHELCHLVHHNHSTAFFALQTKMMPDWEKWKRKLEKTLS